jgi:peroxiredoxin
MFFADDSGMLTQATYDLKAIMQSQIDRSRAENPTSPSINIDEFLITSDWASIKVDDEAAAVTAAVTFKPAAGDKKVDEFNMTDAETSAQHELLNKPAPDFSAKTLDGKPVALKDLKGKVALLQFWATATGMSTRALTVFNSMNMEYAEKGVAMFGVNTDHATMTEQSRRIAAAKLAAYPQIADPDRAIGNAYRVALLPCTILIDKEGVIRSISHDFDAASQVVVAGKLDKLLRGEPLGEEPKPAPFVSPAALRPATPPAAPAPKPAEEPKKP